MPQTKQHRQRAISTTIAPRYLNQPSPTWCGAKVLQIPQSPVSIYRSSLPPSSHPPQHFHAANNYQASPLQQALTPPSHTQDQVDPFPSVESIDNGEDQLLP
jgi:hypothetical protein